jgi:hypothetical protein
VTAAEKTYYRTVNAAWQALVRNVDLAGRTPDLASQTYQAAVAAAAATWQAAE